MKIYSTTCRACSEHIDNVPYITCMCQRGLFLQVNNQLITIEGINLTLDLYT